MPPVVDRNRAREQKIERILPLINPEMPFVRREGRLDFLTDALRQETKIVDTSNVSALGYDADMLSLIEKHRDGLILDCGAGSKSDYYPNIVNVEIVAYPSTDVLAVGEYLPFAEGSFDAVMSVAVLEHVRDPFRCAAELVRVLKPGGDLLCAVPFLQPVHGYPHHYFNATPQGLRRLFEDSVTDLTLSVPDACHPVHALNWMLASWAQGLPSDTREAFLNMRISELLQPSWSMLDAPFARDLPESKRFEIACGTVLTGRKPLHTGEEKTTVPLGRKLINTSGCAFEFVFGQRARLHVGKLVRQFPYFR